MVHARPESPPRETFPFSFAFRGRHSLDFRPTLLRLSFFLTCPLSFRSFLFPAMDLSSSPRPPPSSFSSRNSKASIDSSPSFPGSTSSTRLLQSQTYPSISYRFTASNSSPSLSAASDSPYLGPSRPLSLGDSVSPTLSIAFLLSASLIHAQYTLSPDPQKWGMHISPEYKEEDDDLHKPEPPSYPGGSPSDQDGRNLSWRGVSNVGTLVLLISAIITLL